MAAVCAAKDVSEREAYAWNREAKDAAYIEIKAPAPEGMFNEQSSDQRAKNAPEGPGSKYNCKVLWPLAEWYDIGKDDLAHGDDPAAADALDCTTGEKDGKALGDGRAEHSPEREANDRHHEHLLASKDIREGRNEGLAYSAAEEIGCPRPKGIG